MGIPLKPFTNKGMLYYCIEKKIDSKAKQGIKNIKDWRREGLILNAR